MSLDRVSENYYTAKQARDVLGLKENTFQTWIKAGKIRRVKLPSMGQGVYLKRDIDRIAHTIEAAMVLEAPADIEFKSATLPEVEGEIHLAHLIYGKRALRPEAMRARKRLVEINPECTWYLYNQDELEASLNIVPITHEAVEEFKQGIRGWLFVPDKVLQFTPDTPIEVILIDFMTNPGLPPEKRNFYAEIALRELATTALKSWGARGVEVTKLYTCGSTDDGRKLLRTNKYFKELGEPVENRVIFELDIASSNLALLRPYKEALEAYRETHP